MSVFRDTFPARLTPNLLGCQRTSRLIANHDAVPLDLPPIESEIVDAVFQSEKSIRGEPVESCKLRYFNSFEFFAIRGRPAYYDEEMSRGRNGPPIMASGSITSNSRLHFKHFTD